MSSRGESLRMIAEVSLSASGGTNAVVGGRPLNLWWAEVQPFVRTVLLAPQPSTKVDRVSWSWTQGARSVTASRPEMVAIRRDLEESAAALVAAVPKEAKLRTVFDAYAELLRALASRSNTELERYVCVTPFGPMLHSWGSSVAAIPRMAQSAELEISGTVVVMGKPDGGHHVVLIDSRGSTIGRSRSDVNGHFRFSNIASGRYRLRGVSDRVDFPVTGLPVDLEDISVEHLQLKSSATMAVREGGAKASPSSPELSVPAGEDERPAASSDRVQGRGERLRWPLWIVAVGVIGLLPVIYWLAIGSEERAVADLAVSGSVNQAADEPDHSGDRSAATVEGGGRSRETENEESRNFNRFRNKGLPSRIRFESSGVIDGRGSAAANHPGAASEDSVARSVAVSGGAEGSISDSLDRNSIAARSSEKGFVSKRGGGPALLEGVGQDPAGASTGPGGGMADAKSDAPAAAVAAPNANGSGSSANSKPGGPGAMASGIASISPAAASTVADPSPASGSPPIDAVRSSNLSATPPPSRDQKALSEKKPSDRTPSRQRAPGSPDDVKPSREPSAKADEVEHDPERNSAPRLGSTRSGNEDETADTKATDPASDPATSEAIDKQKDTSTRSPRTVSGAGTGASHPDRGPTLRDHEPLARKFRIRIAPWKSILVRDQIVATTPQPIDSPDETDDRRRELLEQQKKLLPDDLAYAIRWQGIGVSFRADAAGEWRGENGVPVAGGGVGSGEAEIGWPEEELAQDREIHWMTARGREATVTTTRTGEILVAAREGVRVWLWVAVELGAPSAKSEHLLDGAKGGRVVSLPQGAAQAWQVEDLVKPRWARSVQWRSFGSDSKSTVGWRATQWKDGAGRRLEMPLIADAGAQSGARPALVDETTGWALITTVRVTP